MSTDGALHTWEEVAGALLEEVPGLYADGDLKQLIDLALANAHYDVERFQREVLGIAGTLNLTLYFHGHPNITGIRSALEAAEKHLSEARDTLEKLPIDAVMVICTPANQDLPEYRNAINHVGELEKWVVAARKMIGVGKLGRPPHHGMKEAVQSLFVLWVDSHRGEEPKLEYDRGAKITQGPFLESYCQKLCMG